MLAGDRLIKGGLVDALHCFGRGPVPLLRQAIVEDAHIKGLCHFNLHSTVMQALVRIVRDHALRNDRIVQ